MKIGIITGASAGLGKEFYRVVCRRHPELDEIWIIARREERLRSLAEEMPGRKTVCVPLDLTLESSYTALENKLADEKPEIALLINNAGCGRLGNVKDEHWTTQTAQVDLNVKAVTAVTTLCLPYMKKGSWVLNVCSISSFCPNPRMTVYSATKAYLYSYSKSLRFELKPYGINVCAVCPGPMETEFLGIAGISKDNSKAFATLPYCDPVKVTENGVIAAENGQGVYTPKFFFKFYRAFAKVVPHGIVMHFSKT